MSDPIYFKSDAPWSRMVIEPHRTRIFEPMGSERDGATYYGPRCASCNGRRTQRTERGRLCLSCGSEGSLRVVAGSVRVVA